MERHLKSVIWEFYTSDLNNKKSLSIIANLEIRIEFIDAIFSCSRWNILRQLNPIVFLTNPWSGLRKFETVVEQKKATKRV